MKKSKRRWDWAIWLDALGQAQIPEKAKKLGREIPPVMRRTRKALAPWELPSSPGYTEMHTLCYAGLLYLIPGAGHFVPILDPLPAPGSIKVSPAMRRILRLLLNGGDFYFTEPDSRRSQPGWRMRRNWNEPTARIDQLSAHSLKKLGLLEWDGCGNWPVFDHRRYRANMRRLHGVKGFRAASVRWIKEGIERTSKEAKAA